MTESVMLKPCVIVPLSTLRLLWRLEDRGCIFGVDGDEVIVKPRSLLDAADRVALHRHKRDLRTVVRYAAEIVM